MVSFWVSTSTWFVRACLNTLQPWTHPVTAAYCLEGYGVYIFTLNENIGEFILSKRNAKTQKDSKIYSFNEAKFEKWDPLMQKVIRQWREGTLGKSEECFHRNILDP